MSAHVQHGGLMPAQERPMHARHGASSAHMWMPCPGSLNLIATLPEAERNTTSEYAIEGTHAHTVGDQCLQSGAEPTNMIGITLEDHDGRFEVTDEMAEAVEMYTTEVRKVQRELSLPGAPAKLRTEVRFELHERLGAPVPLYGTNDALCWQAEMRGGVMFVWDYKHGRGVPVDVVGNPQLRYYALGALFWLESQGITISEIYIGIVQPRCEHKDGRVRYERITPFELYEWAQDLLDAVAATLEPDAPLVPAERQGEGQCKFCPAAGRCPAQLQRAQELAQLEFTAIEPEDTARIIAQVRAMTIEELDELIEKVDMVQAWCTAVQDAMRTAITHGQVSTKRKMVPTQPRKAWKDPDVVEAAMVGIFGQEPDAIVNKKLKSPAQMEKLLPKDERGLLESYYHKVSGGTKMVPVDHPGEAIGSAPTDDFTPVA